MKRRRWRTAVLWGGCTLCVLIVVAFILSAWWIVVLQFPTPLGPRLHLLDGAIGIDMSDSPVDAIHIQRKSVDLTAWNLWVAGRWWVDVPLYAVFLAVALPTLLVWRFVPKFPRGHCRRCGYNLTGLTEARCPECGMGFVR